MTTGRARKPRGGSGGSLARAVEFHRQGKLSEAAAIYARVPVNDPTCADARHLLGLVEHTGGRHDVALGLIETAIALRPAIPAYHVSHAAVLSALDRPDDAAASAERALSLRPDDPEALNALGIARLRLGVAEAAAESCARALALRPGYAEAASNLGAAWRAAGRLDEAEAVLREAIRLRPGYAGALANLGLVLEDQKRFDEALACADLAIAAEPQNAVAHGNRAMLLLLLGRIDEGFAEYEWRWRMPRFATPWRDFPQPTWIGDDIPDATLLVHAEQGIGSAIQFVRYVRPAAARCRRLVLECQPPLERLFRRSLVAAEGPVAEVLPKGEALPPFDRHIPLMSLPHRLGTTPSTIPATVPYLRADPEDVDRWKVRLDGIAPRGAVRSRVGLVWAGNRKHENDAKRSMPAAALAPLLAIPDIRFFALQLPADPTGIEALEPGVVDLAPELRDFADTAAVFAGLDLVISVDTAAAHLAGALARPAWVLLPWIPEWRWQLDRSDSPWYPTVRLFRQRSAGDWAGVVQEVAAALRSAVAASRSR